MAAARAARKYSQRSTPVASIGFVNECRAHWDQLVLRCWTTTLGERNWRRL